MSRIMAQFTFTSAVLVVLALVVQREGLDGPFRPLALGLGAAVLLTGTMTAMRVHYASHEDLQLVRGMNWLRHAYVDIDPGIERYFVSGTTDDDDGITQTYTMGPARDVPQAFASASAFITAVLALVAGGWVGILVSPAGRAVAVILGALAGLAYVGAFAYSGYRVFKRYDAEVGTPRFPTAPSPADES